MALDLYLVATTTNNVQLVGTGTPKNLKNPFRNDATVTRPLVVSNFALGGDAPVSTTGGATKVDLTELTVTLSDDSVTPALFADLCTGTRLTSVDLLAVDTTNGTRVVAGTGVTPGLVTALNRTVTPAGVQLSLAFDGQKFSVGTAPQRPDGTYAPFTFVTFDVTRGQVT